MLKKIWRWLVGASYSSIINEIDALNKYESVLTSQIRNLPAEEIAKKAITFIQDKLKSVINKIYGK